MNGLDVDASSGRREHGLCNGSTVVPVGWTQHLLDGLRVLFGAVVRDRKVEVVQHVGRPDVMVRLVNPVRVRSDDGRQCSFEKGKVVASVVRHVRMRVLQPRVQH